jgi:hypothetical protein
MKKYAVFCGLLLASAFLNAYAADESFETHSIKQHRVLDANSADVPSVVAWLKQRKAEGKVSEYLDPDSMQLGVFTIEIDSYTKGPIADSKGQNAVTPDTVGGGGVILPPTGNPGQMITITNCNPGVSTVTETWQWQVDSNGNGSWNLVDISTHMNHNVKCAGGN